MAGLTEPIRDPEKIEEMRTYLRRQSARDEALLVVGVYLGLRISDQLKLKVRDVREAHVRVYEKKTGKRRQVLIAPALRAFLDEYTAGMPDDAWLFPSRNGGGRRPIGRARAYEILRAAGEACGVKHVGCHSLRKTFAYQLRMGGASLALLRDLLNHEDEEETARYIGVRQDEHDALIRKLVLTK